MISNAGGADNPVASRREDESPPPSVITTDYIELVTLPNNNSFVIRVALENNAIQRSQGNGAGSSVQRRVVR
jgi:hypothetical protein